MSSEAVIAYHYAGGAKLSDPVNFVDPPGLNRYMVSVWGWQCSGPNDDLTCNRFYRTFMYDDGLDGGGGGGGGGGGMTSAPEITIPKLDLSNRGLTCVKSYEGLSLTVYEDSAGHPTIGYGHLILKGEDFSKGITEPQAAGLLRRDAAQAIKAVQDLVTAELNQDQFDALVSFAFNLGRGNLAKSTLLANINAGNTITEANFTDWNKAGGQVVDGLTARRKDEQPLQHRDFNEVPEVISSRVFEWEMPVKLVLVALLGLLNGGLYAAQTSDEYKACSNGASTQTGLHRCADEELRRADRELNDVYQRLLSIVKDERGAVEKVKAMERAWLLYRDAYVEATYPAADKQAAYGTLFVVDVLLVRVKLTRQHTAALADMMVHHRAAAR